MPKPTHKPTEDTRNIVKSHAIIGTRQEVIADLIGINPRCLRKHYRAELDYGKLQANAAIGGALFRKALNGDTTAMIFWMKTQCGWKEVDRRELTGANGQPLVPPKDTIDASQLSDSALDELMQARFMAKQANDGDDDSPTTH